MIKIGIVGTCFGAESFLDDSLFSFIEYNKKHNNLQISLCHGVFDENLNILSEEERADKKTKDTIKFYFNNKKIHSFNEAQSSFKENELRNLSLFSLKLEELDYIWLVDFADELYSVKDIHNIVEYIQLRQDVLCWKLCFKNFADIDGKKYYLEEPFMPNRIWKCRYKNYQFKEFYYDNDVIFEFNDKKITDKMVKNQVIPQELVWVNHYSWCGDKERLKKKIEYQNAHFGHCSYKWNNEKNYLSFSDEYYEKMNEQKPNIKEK